MEFPMKYSLKAQKYFLDEICLLKIFLKISKVPFNEFFLLNTFYKALSRLKHELISISPPCRPKHLLINFFSPSRPETQINYFFPPCRPKPE